MNSRFPKVIESGNVILTLTPDEVYVEFKEELSSEEIDIFLRDHDLEPVPEDIGTAGFDHALAQSRWLRYRGQIGTADITQSIDRTLADERIRLFSPVYHRQDLLPRKIGITFSDLLLVKLSTQVREENNVDKLLKGLDNAVSEVVEVEGTGLYHLRIKDPKHENTLEVANRLSQSPLLNYVGPDWIQLNSPISTTKPNDTFYSNQWALKKIGAEEGWDLSKGESSVIIAIMDCGCDLNHEDLSTNFVPLADRRDVTVTPETDTPHDAEDVGHGTACAGIAAALSNNSRGVTGLAWNCRIMPIRAYSNSPGKKITEHDFLRAIAWARDRTHRANVISMSFHYDGSQIQTDIALKAAHDDDNIILVAATGNFNPTVIDYPAKHPDVIAVGASDEWDSRVSLSDPSTGKLCWASGYGTGLSVMAPGIRIWTTDLTGNVGFNKMKAGSPPETQTYWPDCDKTSSTPRLYSTGDSNGHYYALFDGTSAATPHVAGLAALLQSRFSYLRSDSKKVRDIIEQTAEEMSSYTYTYDVSHPNGTWNNETGYGRINVFRALDFADVYIKDSPLDNGQLPFAAGHFWDNSDIVVKNIDDGIFEHQSAIKGRDNYIYVRVTNLGPATARNVNVRVVAVPFPGTEFVFPADWAGFTPTYIVPVSMVSHFPSIDSIHSTLVHAEPTVWAKFKLDSSQVDKLYGWETDKRWHPCLLAQVSSDNDYCSPSAGMHSWESNNLAQRNISIINIVYERGGISSAPRFPFLTGNKLNMDLYMEIVVDRSALPKQAEVLLDPYDTDEYFSALEKPETAEFNPNASIKFLDRTRLLLSRPNFKGILTLEAGSVFQEVGKHEDNITIISQQDAEWVIHSGRRLIAIYGENATIGVQKQPGELRQMSLAFKIHEKVKLKDQYQVSVSQRNTKGQGVGGVTILVNVQGD